jgi:hypothetical protein
LKQSREFSNATAYLIPYTRHLGAAIRRYHNVEKEVRRRQIMAFRRYLTAAEDYIENVGKGHFPLRNKL